MPKVKLLHISHLPHAKGVVGDIVEVGEPYFTFWTRTRAAVAVSEISDKPKPAKRSRKRVHAEKDR